MNRHKWQFISKYPNFKYSELHSFKCPSYCLPNLGTYTCERCGSEALIFSNEFKKKMVSCNWDDDCDMYIIRKIHES